MRTHNEIEPIIPKYNNKNSPARIVFYYLFFYFYFDSQVTVDINYAYFFNLKDLLLEITLIDIGIDHKQMYKYLIKQLSC